MAPSLGLQEDLDQRETEGTQDPEETRVQSYRAEETTHTFAANV